MGMVGSAAEKIALLLHLGGAFALVAGATLAAAGFESARRRGRCGEIAALLGVARLGAVLVGAGALVALIFGLWLVHLTHTGFGAGWISGAFVLLIAVAALGGVGGQVPKRARLLAEGLGEGEAATPELRALLDSRAARVMNYLSGALLVVIIVLMVTRPGGSS